MAEPTNTKKRKELPGLHKGSIDMHQRKQGELPKNDTAQTRAASYCGTDMKEGTEEMNLDKVDNDNEYSVHPFKIGKDNEDTYKNIDFFKLGEDHSLIKDAAKKPGAGK